MTAALTPPPAPVSADTSYDRINDYSAVKITLASPADIRSWSFGEVKKPETINYRTYRPEKDGLFCERIFGPEKDWECTCGKYRGMKYKGMICDRCGVKVTHSRVRRKRMGHIELASPVVHIWFFKSMPSRLGNLLDMKTVNLEKIIYYQEYVVVDSGGTPLKEKTLLTEEEYRKAREQYGGTFDAEMGAEAVKRLLERLDLVTLSSHLREEMLKDGNKGSKQKQKDLTKRLKVVESLRDSENKSEWMVLECIPVIPPDLRPLVLLDSGNFATSDLNDLYRRIINRNNRLKKLVDLNAPEVIIRNEKRMLQQSVDALFDNGRCKRPVLGSSNRPLKSLTDMIKGKQGRFRENLLGKRVDYSARSVIVVGPELKLHQCGLPKKIALELYQPFIIRRLKELGYADTIKSAKRMLERKADEVWDILEEVIKNHPVLLNRAPTLHRMGIQAFEPTLIEGNAIRIHPLVCKGFNADFDGDQMAVHLPLSIEAQVEAHVLMMATNNIFSPANGQPIISPSQDIVMGCYFMTAAREGELGQGKVFSSPGEVSLAYAQHKVGLHAKISVRLPIEKKVLTDVNGKLELATRSHSGLVQTTVGRVLFNDILNPHMAFYDLALSSKALARIIADCYQLMGRRETIDLLDRMKETGFRESTVSGLSFATDDLRTPDNKENLIRNAEKEVEKINKSYQRGLLTEVERYNKIIEQWTRVREELTQQMMKELKDDHRGGQQYLNPIYLMAHSGARGGVEQIRQLAGMRGLMAKPSGEILETPIKANFREGLSVLEYFSSTHGARKGLADTALKTADSGYLTRKLCDVAQNVVITTHDCGTTQGITKGVSYKGEEVERALSEIIRGRICRHDIRDPVSDVVLVHENEMITTDKARKIESLGIDKIQVRSPMTCQTSLGICRLCYGMDLATGALVEEGMAVGVISAQSIGEPGTQLTMRTFHIGGVAITKDLGESQHKCKKSGTLKFSRINAVTNDQGISIALARNGEIAIIDAKGREVEKFPVPNGAELRVKDGETVNAGTILCKWDPHVTPILSEKGGKIRYEDIKIGDTAREETDAGGSRRLIIMEHKGDLHPSIVVEDNQGAILDVYFLPEKAHVEVTNGQQISAATVLAKTPREGGGTQDITGGLPRVTELFEARRPKDPAIIAEVSGKVEIAVERTRGKRKVLVTPMDEKGKPIGDPVEHLVPQGKPMRVHGGDFVREGEPLCDGPLVPHDILRVSGTEALQNYLLREIQSVYRSQRVEIDDKHIEITLAQMLRKVKVESVGDTRLLPGAVIDKFIFREVNERLKKCVKVKNPGDSNFKENEVVDKDTFQQEKARVEEEGGKVPTSTTPLPASSSTQLLGITKAAVQSESFISAASFQETTKVLTEAALAGKQDRLVGLKENVILGHLIPAGTGFKVHQEAEVKVNPALGISQASFAPPPKVRPVQTTEPVAAVE
ncbi:MAG: DNA-directed RNA polymerase subunit beta' [Planctomycetia bacterium]|nr:DNA-directed RNA polymerase subunit beta' [Planctomycetia bacterium]